MAALGVSAGGLVAFAMTLFSTRNFAAALSVALELWTAAGLLRLTAESTWKALLTAALIVTIRKLLGFSVSRSAVHPRRV